ncbi:MAG TPA: glycosyltransferase family 2 protein [Blastocatellia bacterium]|nr:glycosyltransferase family 2 protein [Blastocatellia bacterium]
MSESSATIAPPFVTIVIVNYNGGDAVQMCLDSVVSDPYPEREIIVVDNASTDNSCLYPEQLAAIHDDVLLIKNSENVGYAAAINLALRRARGVYLAVLNMDITVTRGWLTTLVDFLERNPDAAAVNPLITLRDGARINAAGQDIHITGLGFNRGLGQLADRIEKSPQIVSGVQGGAFVIRKSSLMTIGGMDETGFLYHEDVNLSWLLQLLGQNLYCVPGAVVSHDYHLTMYPGKLYLLERNRWAMLLSYLNPLTLLILSPALALTELFMCCFCLLRGLAFIRAKLESVKWVIRQRSRLRLRRDWLNLNRDLTDWALLRKMHWGYAWHQFLILGKESGPSSRHPSRRLPNGVME